MAWVLYNLVQATVVGLAVFCALAVENVFLRIAIIAFAAFFIWRSLNHPDYVFRRLATSCVAAAVSMFGLQHFARVRWTKITPQDATLHEVALFIGEEGGSLAYGLLLVAVLFGGLDILRMRTAQRDGASSRQTFRAYGDRADVVREQDGRYRYRAVLTLRNRGSEAVHVTGARVARLGVLPSAHNANLYLPRGSTDEPLQDAEVVVAGGEDANVAVVFRQKSRCRDMLQSRAPLLLRLLDCAGLFIQLRARQKLGRQKVALDLLSETPDVAPV